MEVLIVLEYLRLQAELIHLDPQERVVEPRRPRKMALEVEVQVLSSQVVQVALLETV